MFGIETLLIIIGTISQKQIVRLKVLPNEGDHFLINKRTYTVSRVLHIHEGGRHTAEVTLV